MLLLGLHSSKSLLRPVIAVADVQRIDGAREAIGGRISISGVFGRRDRYVTNWNDAGQAAFVEGWMSNCSVATLAWTVRSVLRFATADDKLVVLTAATRLRSAPAARDTARHSRCAEAKPWTNRKATDSSAVPHAWLSSGRGSGRRDGHRVATAWDRR